MKVQFLRPALAVLTSWGIGSTPSLTSVVTASTLRLSVVLTFLKWSINKRNNVKWSYKLMFTVKSLLQTLQISKPSATIHCRHDTLFEYLLHWQVARPLEKQSSRSQWFLIFISSFHSSRRWSQAQHSSSDSPHIQQFYQVYIGKFEIFLKNIFVSENVVLTGEIVPS